MSHTSCNHLARLAQSALRLQPDALYLNHGRYVHASRPLRVETNSHDKTTDRDDGKQSREHRTRSSFHQSYHRTAYERKKEDYQNDRAHQRSHTRSVSYMSSPSTTHYQRLNVAPRSGLEEIKSAYYQLSKQYHPDIVGKENPDASENFRLITESYDLLSDPKARADYDKQFSTDIEPTFNPAHTAWKPSGTNHQENESVFRMREANRIFRSKQEAALERERERNPAKFRAGSFKYDKDDCARSNLLRIENQIRAINANKSFMGRESDMNQFYRMHLYDTLHRRRLDLEEMQSSRSATSSSDGSIMISLIGILGLFTFAVLSAVSLVYDIDLARYMDTRLQQGPKKKESEDSLKEI